MPFKGVKGIPGKVGLGDMSGYLQKDNNLSDLSSKPDSRAHLGVPAGVDKQMCTAWVTWSISSAAATINDSHNVSSVTRTGLGTCRINFTTPMSNKHYCPVYTSSQGDPSISGNSVTAKELGYLDVLSWSGTGIGNGVIFNRADHFDNNIQVKGGK